MMLIKLVILLQLSIIIKFSTAAKRRYIRYRHQRNRVDRHRKYFYEYVEIVPKLPFVVIIEHIQPYDRINHTNLYRHCSGSLISSIWVLTAAHCVDQELYLHIRYGDIQAPKTAKNTFSKILKQIPHPNFRMFDKKDPRNPILNNDIALMEVEKVPLKQFIKISAVDYMNMMGHAVSMAGFGKDVRSNVTGSNSRVDKMAMKFGRGVVRKCRDESAGYGPMICCTYKWNRPYLITNVDSGGPMIYRNKLIGLSTGPMHLKSHMGVGGTYTAVSPFLSWIRKTVQKIII